MRSPIALHGKKKETPLKNSELLFDALEKEVKECGLMFVSQLDTLASSHDASPKVGTGAPFPVFVWPARASQGAGKAQGMKSGEVALPK